MAAHSARVDSKLAKTKVVSEVNYTLDYAWSQKGLVKIEGGSRTGKTESVKAWCEKNPGQGWFISMPSGKMFGTIIARTLQSKGILQEQPACIPGGVPAVLNSRM